MGRVTTAAPNRCASTAVSGSAVTTRTRPRRHTGNRRRRQSVASASARLLARDAGRRVQARLGRRATLDGHDEAPRPRVGGHHRPIVAELARVARQRPRQRGGCTSRPRQDWSTRVTASGSTPCLSPTGSLCAIVRPLLMAPHQARLARRGAPAGDGRLRGRAQPPLLRRPARRSPTSSYDNGHPPYFLGKESVFRVPVVGRASCAAPSRSRSTATPGRRPTPSGPPSRRSTRASASAIYPEGTLTRDPDLWPMVGKTGAARIALDAPVPRHPRGAVGPAGDARALLPSGRRLLPAQDDARARRAARRPADLYGQPIDAARAARGDRPRSWRPSPALLEGIRGEQAPASGSTRASTALPDDRASFRRQQGDGA